ncbi:glycosyl hydrolase [Kocuria arenosa]|uniref:glycosyl hydrolase n=1 Tax=Kocuria arenosa TaxID=3071446 RepID=UPI0034D61422
MDAHHPNRRSVLTAAATAALVTACTDRTTIETFPPHHRVHPLEHGVFLPHGPQDGPAFTTMIGAAPQWMLLFRDWTHETPPVGALEAVRVQGATPVLTWEPWYAPPMDTAPADASHQPVFALARMAAGDHDHRIGTWAEALASWGHDVVLRFAHEMNGHWYPWGAGVQGNTADQYVRAWHHVHATFAAAGAAKSTGAGRRTSRPPDPARTVPGLPTSSPGTTWSTSWASTATTGGSRTLRCPGPRPRSFSAPAWRSSVAWGPGCRSW